MATTELKDIQQEPWYEGLFSPSYRIGEAARYVGAHPRTVSAWHARDNTAPPPYKPRDGLSYLQLVELAFVTTLRDAGIPVRLIRAARGRLAEEFNFEHPFARHEFMTVGNGALVDLLGGHAGAPRGPGATGRDNGLPDWRGPLEKKFMEFDYQYGLALRWHLAGRESQVMIDPRHRWGWPMVQGLETWAIKGSYDAGETLEDIAEDYAVTIDGVLDALRFEGVSEVALV